LKIKYNNYRRGFVLGDRLCRFAAEHVDSFLFQIAETYSDLITAFNLVYHEYLARGYCQPKPSEIHYTHFCILPDSRTFLLTDKKSGQIRGTASLVLDSSSGLPMESLFGPRLSDLRKENRRLAEVTLLCMASKSQLNETHANRNKLSSIFTFFKHVFNYALTLNVSDLVIVVNPRHVSIYQYLTFEPLGDIYPYPDACGNPAQLMHLDLIRFCNPQFRRRLVQKFFLEQPFSYDSDIKPAHWNFETVEKLLLLSDLLAPEWRFILETYLKSPHRIFA